MSQNNVNIPSQPDHTLSNLNQSSKDFFLNDFSIASFKIHKEHLEDMEDFLETTRNPHNNKNPTKFMRSIPLTKLPPLLHKFKAPKNMTRIAPYMGTAYDLKSKENNESNEPVAKTRAQINWSRLKKAIHIVRVQEKFKRTMTDRDKRISQGQTMSETEFEQHFSFFQNIIHKIKHGYINPKNHYLVLWKFLLQCSIICSSIAVPYRFAFGTDLNKPGPIRTLLILMDIYFAFDIILTFFIARLKTDGTLMTNRKTIAKVYIKGLFFIDTLTLLPYEVFYQELVLLKLFRLLHLGNFFKTIKQIIEYATFLLVKGLRATVIAHFLGSLLTTFVIIFMIVNFFACMWISLGIPTNNKKDQGVIYVCSLYFMVQTIVSIGYGDSVGVTTREYLFCIAVLFFGVLGFAFMFGKIEAAINLYNDISLRQNKQKEDIETWMRRVEANIEEHLNCRGEMMMALVEAKLTQASSQDWQSSIGVNKHFKQLNPRMKSTILHFALRNLQKRFRTFFRGLSEDFIHEIMAESESRLFLASDIIMTRGTRPEGVYLVLDGSVAVTGRTFTEVFRHLAPNSFFGDLAILNDRPISISFIAETEVSCLLIKREVFEKIEGKYPEDLARMKVLAHNRYRSFLNMKRNYEKLQVVRNSSPRKTYMATLQKAPGNNNTFEIQDSNDQRFGTQAMALVSFIHTERPLVENERSNTSERRYERSPSIDQYIDPIDRPSSSSRIRTHRRSSDSFKKHYNALFSDESDIESIDDSTDDDDDTAHISKHPEREENSDSDSDLNYSDICPLEDIIPDFEDIGERYKMIDYLQGRVLFIKEKFKIMQKKIEADLQYIKRKTEINAKNLTSTSVD